MSVQSLPSSQPGEINPTKVKNIILLTVKNRLNSSDRSVCGRRLLGQFHRWTLKHVAIALIKKHLVVAAGTGHATSS